MELSLPEGLAGGTFAEFARIWHTADVFVFDFAVITDPPKADAGMDPAVKATVVSRVRLPPSQAWQIMRALEHQLSAWERETGRSGS